VVRDGVGERLERLLRGFQLPRACVDLRVQRACALVVLARSPSLAQRPGEQAGDKQRRYGEERPARARHAGWGQGAMSSGPSARELFTSRLTGWNVNGSAATCVAPDSSQAASAAASGSVTGMRSCTAAKAPAAAVVRMAQLRRLSPVAGSVQ